MGLQTLRPGAAPAEPPQGHLHLQNPRPLATEAAVWGDTLCPELGSAGPRARLQEGNPLHLFGGKYPPCASLGRLFVLVRSAMLRRSTPARLYPGGPESAGAKPEPRAEAHTPAQLAAATPHRVRQGGGWQQAGQEGGQGSEGPAGPGCCRTAASGNTRRGTRGHTRPPRAFQLL